MRTVKIAIIAAVFALSAFAQGRIPPIITVGTEAISPSLCQLINVGNIYVRSQNPNNGPVYVQRCTQVASTTYEWQPIDHLTVATLPSKCSVGDIAFRTGVTAGQNIYGCTSINTWTLQSGGSGGAPPFSSVTAGTNTTTLVVGTGGTLTASGSGSIVATNLTAATGLPDGNYCVSITSGVLTLTQTNCPGSGGGGLALSTLTNGQLLSLTNGQLSAITN